MRSTCLRREPGVAVSEPVSEPRVEEAVEEGADEVEEATETGGGKAASDEL